MDLPDIRYPREKKYGYFVNPKPAESGMVPIRDVESISLNAECFIIIVTDNPLCAFTNTTHAIKSISAANFSI